LVGRQPDSPNQSMQPAGAAVSVSQGSIPQ
jgi:hypothetical protein